MAKDAAENKYELSGKLAEKFDPVQRGSFASREFIVEKSIDFNGKTITNYIKFQCTGERTGIIDKVKVGEEIKVHFNIRGNKWEKEGRVSYFTNLDAWRIEPGLVSAPAASEGNNDYLEPLDTFTSSPDEAIDDLPF
ncbi:MAG: DUF3127 domain-containing protein [Bacteroidetes bacterium]|nr:DUF3127 domain-containing protein [Bacteroidota bacterium]